MHNSYELVILDFSLMLTHFTNKKKNREISRNVRFIHFINNRAGSGVS